MNNLKIEYIPIIDLKVAEYNPRKITKKALDDIKKSISRFGIIDPLIVNHHKERKNILIGGHLRLKALMELKIKKAPVVYISIKDIKKEKELNVRLNKNLGEFDEYKLFNEFTVDELKDYGFDFDKRMDKTDIAKNYKPAIDVNAEADYMLIYFDNKTDFINFCEKNNIEETKNPKNSKIGVARALRYEDMK